MKRYFISLMANIPGEGWRDYNRVMVYAVSPIKALALFLDTLADIDNADNVANIKVEKG